jgi:hypothetical protein
MKRGNKYGAKKSLCAQGHTHDSKREAARCDHLHLLELAGEIMDLEVHPQFWFEIDGKQLKHLNGHRVGYKADFLYTDMTTAARVVEDVKGMTARDWPLRKAIFSALNPHLELRVVK